MHSVYILYSKARNRYYIGSSSDVEGRIRRHNTNHSGFTGHAGDWELVWHKEFENKTEALTVEKKIKGWKNRSMIERLIAGKYE